jgi:hypothetical protein
MVVCGYWLVVGVFGGSEGAVLSASKAVIGLP